MDVLTTKGWNDYELIDSGEGRRLERYGAYVLDRPDPQCIWKKNQSKAEWQKADAVFQKNEHREGWQKSASFPEKWRIVYDDLSLYAHLTPFKHTGIFPEQSLQWEFMRKKLQKAKSEGQRESRVLNLFGYTGIASLVCAKEGAQVTHVDASRPSIGWARENQEASNLSDLPIRWILDDALKFCEREVRRGNQYDGILMDPPIYGHGPEGERWEFFEFFPKLLSVCRELLSSHPIFVLVNAYAISSSSVMLDNMMREMMGSFAGKIESGELALQEKSSDRLLSTGIFSRWSEEG